ncbi:DNA polymerase III subunit beta [Ktedonobacteria bacterium brp13]|nr:DNA polymerase III subunit beta [Ktedonobacteria bacterium brp13]
MKITCKQADLAKALSTVSHAVSSRSTLPILANILIQAEQGHLKLSATNLEIGITCTIDAEVFEEGSTTVPAKTFTDLVTSLRAGQVELIVEEDSHDIKVKSTGSKANIKGMDPEEFPHIAGAEGGENPIVLEAGQLKEMIAQVVIAAADDDARPVLTGVLVEVHGGTYDGASTLTFSGADAFRLAHRVVGLPLQGYEGVPSSVIIPARSLSELARILPAEGTVQMIVTTNRSQVLFHTEQIDLVSRLIEGTFPNIKAAIPLEHKTRIVVETKEIAAALKSVQPFARDSANIVRFKASNDTLTLEATAEDVGNNITTIGAGIDGPDQEIILNARYLGEVLGVIGSPKLAMELISPARPCAVKPVGSTDYTYIIMPMSTNR